METQIDTSLPRCSWCGKDRLYIKYHDQEWGKPCFDDHILFEFLILETFQAGLSWITILRKREHFRRAFDNFNFQKVSQYNDKKVESLKQDQGIIRNRLKIQAAINNAKKFIEVREKFGSFSDFLWNYVNHKPIINHYKMNDEIPTTTNLAKKISKEMKQLGFKFVGETIIYAKMQAIGMVNDHIESCAFKHQ